MKRSKTSTNIYHFGKEVQKQGPRRQSYRTPKRTLRKIQMKMVSQQKRNHRVFLSNKIHMIQKNKTSLQKLGVQVIKCHQQWTVQLQYALAIQIENRLHRGESRIPRRRGRQSSGSPNIQICQIFPKTVWNEENFNPWGGRPSPLGSSTAGTSWNSPGRQTTSKEKPPWSA